jgi:hypothetical protein
MSTQSPGLICRMTREDRPQRARLQRTIQGTLLYLARDDGQFELQSRHATDDDARAYARSLGVTHFD